MSLRQEEFADGLTSASAPNTGTLEASSLQQHANDAAFVSSKGSAASAGDVYYNTTNGVIRYYDDVNSTWRSKSTLDGTETLTNKTLTSPTINAPTVSDGSASNLDLTTPDVQDQILMTEQGSAPSAPASGKNSLYFKTDGKLYYKDDGGNETEVGSGGGSGVGDKNYFLNPFFNDNIDDVSTYDDTGAYSDGTGGTPSVISAAQTLTTSEVLEGAGSLKISKSASDASGEGVSLAMTTIDAIDRGKELVFELAHDGGSSNYNGSDISVHAYDFTSGNNVELDVRPLTFTDSDQNNYILGFQATQKFAIQTLSDSEDVRVSLHIETDNASASAWDLVVDEVKFGPQSPNVISQGNKILGTNILSADETTDSTDISDLTRTDLQIGKKYRISGQVNFENAANDLNLRLEYRSASGGGGTEYGRTSFGNGDATNSPEGHLSPNIIFTAVSTDLYVRVESLTAGSSIKGNGSREETFITVEEVNESNIQVGVASTYKMSTLCANGTRVTSTPTKLGEYRTLIKDSSARTFSDTDGSSKVTEADGFQIFSVNGTSAGTSTEPNRIEMFVGKNKIVKSNFFSSSGRTGIVATDYYYIESTGGDEESGLYEHYDPTTGVYTITLPVVSTDFNRYVGREWNSSTDELTVLSSCYVEVIVSENVQAIGFDPQNKYQIKTLSSDATSNGIISDLTFDNLVPGKVYKVTLNGRTVGGGTGNVNIEITHDSNVKATLTNTTSGIISGSQSVIFTATASSVTFVGNSLGGGDTVLGDGTQAETFSMLEELNNYRLTTEY